jgi:acyl carrier protein
VNTQDRITQIFTAILDVEVPSPEADLLAGGWLDSLALVTLLFEIEQEFGVRLPLERLDIDALSTVRQIAAVVDELSSPSRSSLAESHGP